MEESRLTATWQIPEETEVDAFIKALEAHIAAAEARAEQLLKEGETRAAEIKAAVTAELKSLLAELQKVLGGGK